jgi:hypothetical protein
MEEIKAPKKERKFLKAIGNIGKVLAEELIMGIARKFIGKVVDKVKLPKKRETLSLLFLLSCSIAFAQFPSTGNKQRLGFQTTADGLVWRGSISDTASIQPTTNQNAWLIVDTINLKIYSFDFTSNNWNLVSGGGTTIDTTSLSNRINLKVNISDTAAMLLPYFKDADTSFLNLVSRFALKLNISDTAAMLLPYASKTYVDTAGRFYARQDFTNVTSSTLTWTQTDTLVPLGVSKIMVYRNGQILLTTQYTIPTKTTVVIGATAYKLGENYTVIFPKGGGGSGGSGGGGGGSGSVTSISQGTGIIANPNPITSTGTISADTSFLFTQSDTASLNLTTRFASKLNTADTTSLSNRINAKGTGTVTSIGSGFGLLGGTITTTGTLLLDSATVFNRIRDSIVDVAIGNDTIKILKQEYSPATTSVLTWTITAKFPIQLKAYILVFRNGQLLNNDQYNLTDTNKITIVSTSFKSGANYTVATVSGIGSVSSGQSNPIYPEAGIALSTGTTWTTSITNNSSNWNTAFTDRLKWDGGSTGLVVATGRTSLGGTTIGQSMFTLTNPSAITYPQFNADNSVSALSAASFRSAIGSGTVTSVTALGTAGNPISITNNTTTPTIELLSATTSRNGYLTSTDWTTFNNKFAFSDTTSLNLTTRFATKLNYTDTSFLFTQSDTNQLNLTSRFATKLNYTDTSFLFTQSDTNQLNLTSRFATKLNYTDTSFLFTQSDTNQLNLTSRFAAKQNNITLTTTGTSGAATLIGATLNIPQYSGGGGGTGTVTSVGLTAPSIFTVGGSPVTTSGTLALTYSGTALPLLNGGTGATTADGALNNLGATAQGKLLFGLQNTVSEKFIKVNTDNTITLLNAADTRSAIGAGTGTVTSVSGTGAISVATGTTTPVISVADAAFGTAGIVTSTGTQQFSGDKVFEGITQFNGRALFKDYTYTATRLAGLSSTDRFATVTIGTGLSLASGTLSATGGGVTSVTASTPLSSSGGATPNITITDAGTGASGVVNTTTQSFAGNKTFTGTLNVSSTGTFGGRVNTPWLERTYTSSTSSSFTVSVNTTWLDINTSVLTTLTLPNAATYPGKELNIRQTGTGQLISFSSNVIPFTSPPSGSAGTAILNPTNNKAVTLVSDGVNWIIMQRSGN